MPATCLSGHRLPRSAMTDGEMLVKEAGRGAGYDPDTIDGIDGALTALTPREPGERMMAWPKDTSGPLLPHQ